MVVAGWKVQNGDFSVAAWPRYQDPETNIGNCAFLSTSDALDNGDMVMGQGGDLPGFYRGVSGVLAEADAGRDASHLSRTRHP